MSDTPSRRKRKRKPNPGGRGGRPAYEPSAYDRGRVEAWAACGVQLRAISHLLGISHTTVDKHFKDELEIGREIKKARISERIFAFAMGEIPDIPVKVQATCMMFIGKTQFGWKDRQAVEVSGPDGEPIEFIETVVVDPARTKG